MLIQDSSKNFEKIPTGRYYGTIIDVVDLGKVKNSFGEEKTKVRVVWILNANDSQGVPFRAIRQVNATVAAQPRKSNLYEICEGVFGTAPALPFDTETLIGRSNELVIMLEKDPNNGKEFSNVKVILPLPAGVIPPQAPQGFVRAKDKPARPQQQRPATVVSSAQPIQTVVVSPAQPIQAVVANPLAPAA